MLREFEVEVILEVLLARNDSTNGIEDEEHNIAHAAIFNTELLVCLVLFECFISGAEEEEDEAHCLSLMGVDVLVVEVLFNMFS